MDGVPAAPVRDHGLEGRDAGRDALAVDRQDGIGVAGAHGLDHGPWPGVTGPRHQPLRPRASTGHSAVEPSWSTAITLSTRSTTGQTWFGITATTAPSSGRAASAGTATMPW